MFGVTFTVYLRPNYSLVDLLASLIFFSSFLFPFSGLYFFLFVTILNYEMLRHMRVEIVKSSSLPHSIARGHLESNLRKWNGRYHYLVMLIDSINDCFGLILLQAIFFFYISTVVNAFDIFLFVVVVKIPEYSSMYVFYLLKNLVYLWVIAYFPSKVKQEVRFTLLKWYIHAGE